LIKNFDYKNLIYPPIIQKVYKKVNIFSYVIKPYAIAGSNLAKEIRKRFDKETSKFLFAKKMVKLGIDKTIDHLETSDKWK
jgi:hypothetical protein